MIMFDNVYKFFGFKQVLCGVNLIVFKGESMVIIGGFGIGKFVIIKSVFGLIMFDVGKIIVDGEDVIYVGIGVDCDVFLVCFGMLFQGGVFFDSFIVW